MELDEREQEKASNPTALLETPAGARFAPGLVVAAAGGWKPDELEGAIVGNRCERLGR